MHFARWPLALVLLLTLAPAAAQQGELEDRRERLQATREQIGALEEELAARHQRAEGLDAELAELEQRVAAAARAVRETEQQLAAQRERLAALEQRQAAERERLAAQREFLAEQVRAAWRTGEAPFLRLLLSQERPGRIDRLAVYYRYFTHARAQRIEAASEALQALASLREEVDATLAGLEELRATKQQQREQLAARLDEREATLERVRARIEQGDERLARLRENETRLDGLVSDLRARLQQLRERQRARAERGQDNAPSGGVASGEAGWPVDGEVIAEYGSARLADLRWSGVLIAAERGMPVHAVAAGEVVFSDWLRGVGLLLIIDHGNGRLSLYGHNQTLYREAGERVDAGEVIAGVGASGGQRRSALYFEVRVDGEPVDPVAWLDRLGARG